MSNQVPTLEPVFDPYHFPNITAESLERDVTFVIFGVALYEMVMCLNVYLTVCSKAKLKTAIFQLITVAVFSVAASTVVMILLQMNLTRTIQSRAEYILSVLNIVLMVLAKFGYYIAATLRTRALLGRFPKILYSFYIMLTVSIINNLVLLGLIVHFFAAAYHNSGEMFIPMLIKISDRYMFQASFTTIFDMVFANALIVSFLYPIFAAQETNFSPALKAMIQLGDVQKALVSSTSSILSVVLTLSISDPQLSLVRAPVALWMISQNTHFLRLSYFSSSELLKNNVIRTNEKNRTDSAPKKAGGILPENFVPVVDL